MLPMSDADARRPVELKIHLNAVLLEELRAIAASMSSVHGASVRVEQLAAEIIENEAASRRMERGA